MTDKSALSRVKMSEQRAGDTRKVGIAGWELYITVNYFENDQPGEVFVSVGKNGTTVSGLMQTIAIQFSMLLQAGVPCNRITDNMRHHKFEPKDENFDSIVDALASTVLQSCSDRGSQIELDHSLKEVQW